MRLSYLYNDNIYITMKKLRYNSCWYQYKLRAGFILHTESLRKYQPFANSIFTCIFSSEEVFISIRFSQKFIPKGPIDNK